MSVPPKSLKTPPPAKHPFGAQISVPVPPVIVRPTTLTVPDETVRVVPAPRASRVAGAPRKVRSLETLKVPTQVPETVSVDPSEAASIAG